MHSIITLRNEKNCGIGFSRARGVDYSLDRGYEYILNLDDDAIIYKNTVEKLFNVIRQDN